jgi:DUF1680 family protein
MIYSFEQADNQVSLSAVTLPRTAVFRTEFDRSLAGGVVKITTDALVRKETDWEHRLYQPADMSAPRPVRLTAVPYAIWGNRGLGEMVVWINSSY